MMCGYTPVMVWSITEWLQQPH